MVSRRVFATTLSVGAALSAHDEHESSPALDRVAMIHGATGPFAIAGYRMGEEALKQLKLNRGSFDVEVIHHSPREVQWSCIIDGLQAATGASVGKLNLSLVESPAGKVYSVIRHRKSGQELRLALTPSFIAEYLHLPPNKLAAASARLTAVPVGSIFTVRSTAKP